MLIVKSVSSHKYILAVMRRGEWTLVLIVYAATVNENRQQATKKVRGDHEIDIEP